MDCPDLVPPPDRGRLKMADIARMAGVSISTVSRALAGNPLIPDPLRERVVELARTHGYVVNQSARSLRLRKTETIGVIIPLAHEAGQMISDPFFLEMVGRLADEITRRDHLVLLNRVIATEPGWLDRIIQSHRADGLLVIGQGDQHEALNSVAAFYRPMVVWGAPMPDQRYCLVGADNREGARLAVTHLAARGRRRIVFLGKTDAPEAAHRFEGYLCGLETAGIAFDPALVVPSHYTRDDAERAVEALLDSGVAFDAIFAFSDVLAVTALTTLRRSLRAGARDVAVVGFDDIMLSQHSTPSLTTIRQDMEAGARTMVDLLFRRMGGDDTSSVIFPVELVVRESA